MEDYGVARGLRDGVPGARNRRWRAVAVCERDGSGGGGVGEPLARGPSERGGMGYKGCGDVERCCGAITWQLDRSAAFARSD